MTKRNQSNARRNTTRRATYDANVDYDDNHDVNRDATMRDDDVIQITTNANQIVTLKHIIETHKIKCDAKLIRRVLRKYYASKIDHKLRDAWTFNTNQINDVVTLINTHCRANTSSQKSI